MPATPVDPNTEATNWPRVDGGPTAAAGKRHHVERHALSALDWTLACALTCGSELGAQGGSAINSVHRCTAAFTGYWKAAWDHASSGVEKAHDSALLVLRNAHRKSLACMAAGEFIRARGAKALVPEITAMITSYLAAAATIVGSPCPRRQQQQQPQQQEG